jgi:hypothetical protein
LDSSHALDIVPLQGPVINTITRRKAEEDNTPPGEEGLNFWCVSLAVAEAIRYHEGDSSGCLLLGGQTGGKVYPSESRLTQRLLIWFGVPEEVIEMEEDSTNSLENMRNAKNLRKTSGRRFRILGANYHVRRLRLLMDMFGISWEVGLGSHNVIRSALARGFSHPTILAAIEEHGLLDIPTVRDPDDSTGFYRNQKGTEQKSYFVRAYEEDAFIRLLLEEPTNIMCYLPGFTDDADLSWVMQYNARIFPGYFEGLGIDPFSIDPEMMAHAREVLATITRLHVPTWIAENMPNGWPEETLTKLEALTRHWPEGESALID